MPLNIESVSSEITATIIGIKNKQETKRTGRKDGILVLYIFFKKTDRFLDSVGILYQLE
jgi:hypothetical protein